VQSIACLVQKLPQQAASETSIQFQQRLFENIPQDMANILYAWELGNNLGHVGSFVPLAKELTRRGHDIHLVLARSKGVQQLLLRENMYWLQAPGHPDICPTKPPLSYSDILLHFGYATFEDLLPLVVAWREVMKLSSAALVLADHAPTALIAARTLGLPVMLHGTAFCIPPVSDYCPSLRPWSSHPTEKLKAIDSAALQSINGVLQYFGTRKVRHIHDLFKVEETRIIGDPELECYHRNLGTGYWGVESEVLGATPVWPPAKGPRLFVYARATSPGFDLALAHLRDSGASLFVVSPGISKEKKQELEMGNIVISDQPVSIHRAAATARACVLLGGGLGTAVRFLKAGVPVVLIPEMLESFLLGLKIQQMGAGAVCPIEQIDTLLPSVLKKVLSESLFQEMAQKFSERNSQTSQESVVRSMANRAEELACAAV
jgi:UDP:flavonoid glycosyltransferase YjiC (YdhE family)